MWEGPKPKKPKPTLDQPIQKRVEWWINSSKDQHPSSEFIVHVLGDVPWQVFCGKSSYGQIPINTSNFGTCYRLLELIPEWKDKIFGVSNAVALRSYTPKGRTVAEVPSDTWIPLVEAWEELTDLYTGKNPAKCYKLITNIISRKK